MPSTRIRSVDSVGSNTVALTLEAPDEFDAFPGQFVLVRATIDGAEETGHYTLSSPAVDQTFEITVKADPDGTLGPWLADREEGDWIEFDGPFGKTTYEGDDDAVVLASGPGIGPAVGIGERARATDAAVTILYGGGEPAHAGRLDSLDADAAEVRIGITDFEDHLADVEDADRVYVFGFASFAEEATKAIADAGLDTELAHIENFGPE